MKTVFLLSERFGSFLSDGEAANAFRFTEVEPLMSKGHEIVFDFAGVTNMTSSFCNALVATLIAHHESEFNASVRFANCEMALKELIRAAIALGRREAREYA